MTSDAINQGIKNSLIGYHSSAITTNNLWEQITIKTWVAFFVLICGLIISFSPVQKKKLRVIQLTINTLILGFWCGKFISLKTLMSWITNGTNMISGGIIIFMLVLALLMPILFKKPSYYCNWICPLGSLQELAGKITRRKLSPGQRLLKYLNYSQEIITLALLTAMWLGLSSDIADYEPFSAFLFQHATWGVTSIVLISLVTSVFIPKPWCRFACPTGQLLKWSQRINA